MAIAAVTGGSPIARLQRRWEAPAPSFKPPPPSVTGPRLELGSEAKEPPFVGESGDDAHGYPYRKPDMIALLDLLRLKRFDTLEAWMTYYQSAFEGDFRKEYWPDIALSSFYVADPEVGKLIDEWLARSPGHFAPWAARGNHRLRMATYYRGTKWAHETSRAQFASAHEYKRAAAEDFQHAIMLRPNLVSAYKRLVNSANALPESQRFYLDAGTRVCPECYTVRLAYMSWLMPRWGGSLAQVEAYAREIEPLFETNPKLSQLAGYPAYVRGRVALDAKRKAEASRHFDEAIRAGEEPTYLIWRVWAMDPKAEARQSLPFIERALRVEPQARFVIERGLSSFMHAREIERAAELLHIRRRTAPTEDLSRELTWTIEHLRYRGSQLAQDGRYAAALRALELGTRLDPDDHDFEEQAVPVRAILAAELPQFDDPNDYEARLAKDHALAAEGRFPEVVRMWDAYIAEHPNDARAYAERGGAKWNLRWSQAGLNDLVRACQLGLPKACDTVPKLKAQLQR